MDQLQISFFALVIILFSSSHDGWAQNQQDNTAFKEGMEKIEWFVGHWEGEGWIMTPERTRETFKQTETIQWKLDKTVLMVEGRGLAADEESGQQRVIHDALALISYNPQTKNYSFKSHLFTGQKGDYFGRVTEDGAFVWILDSMPGRLIKYTIRINEKEQWHEIGEIQIGETWYPFFEMTLDRKE